MDWNFKLKLTTDRDCFFVVSLDYGALYVAVYITKMTTLISAMSKLKCTIHTQSLVALTFFYASVSACVNILCHI